ncbi:hypothetical protein B7463_g7421, partial [Scytalidium lignicola]
MTQTLYTTPLPSINARPSAVRKYFESVLIERFELTPEEAAKTASVWKYGDGSELRFRAWNQDPPISPSFMLFGSQLGPRLQAYVMAQGFAEWKSSLDGICTRGLLGSAWIMAIMIIIDCYIQKKVLPVFNIIRQPKNQGQVWQFFLSVAILTYEETNILLTPVQAVQEESKPVRRAALWPALACLIYRLQSAIKRIIKKECFLDWRKEWPTAESAAQCRQWWGNELQKGIESLYNMQKAMSSVLIQMRTGKIGLKAYLHKINRAESSLCDCEEDDQTMVPSGKKQKLVKSWQEIAKEAQDHREASLAQVKLGLPDLFNEFERAPRSIQSDPSKGVAMKYAGAVLHPRDVLITEMLPENLITALATGKLSATDVTTAFLRRAVVAQRVTNCITELLPEQALARARYLDDYLFEHKKPIGPLHGLPISVKEMIGMKDLGLNAGYVAWWGRTASEDAHVLRILWDAGAVFHARTTQPQSMMHLETDSNLYGVTVNPYSREVSAGGSSGGEGALIGMRGSCLGIGSDIGGSIRSPAANCGIFGFKLTAFRIPTDGWSSTMVGADPIPGVIGPMSTSLEGVKIFIQTILDSKPWLSEPALIPMPWSFTPLSSNQRLKIGVMWHDNVVTPHPPITRALNEVVSKLKGIPNVEVVDWNAYLHDEAWAIISSLYFTDGGAEDAKTIAESGEPWRPLTKWIIKENPCVKKLTPQKLYYWQEEREAYRKEYAKVWNDTATGPNGEGMVDAILCPVGPGVAPAHNTAKYWGYTSQWNLLDCPAIVFPVSKLDPGIDTLPNEFHPLTDLDVENWKLYDVHKFSALPVSLQLVGRRFEDEKLLAILEYITKQIGLPFVEFP